MGECRLPPQHWTVLRLQLLQLQLWSALLQRWHCCIIAASESAVILPGCCCYSSTAKQYGLAVLDCIKGRWHHDCAAQCLGWATQQAWEGPGSHNVLT